MPLKKYKTKKQAKKAYVINVNKSLKKLTKSYAFRFMKDSDKEVIDKLDSVPNKSDYIRQLILADIKKKD